MCARLRREQLLDPHLAVDSTLRPALLAGVASVQAR
jgi:hypothetical protein